MSYKARLRELYVELGSSPKGPQWAEMARILNMEGILSPNGKPWTGGNLKQNYERMARPHPAVQGTSDIPHPAVQGTSDIPHPAVQGTSDIPLSLSPEDFEVLRHMIDERKGARVPSFAVLPQVIPDIEPLKGSGTSIRLRPDFLEAAMKRARELYPNQRLTITRLLNWLLMLFAGIETDPKLTEVLVHGESQRNDVEGT